MDKGQVIDMFRLITANYPNAEITSEKVDLYSESLEDVPYSVALQNVMKHFKSSRFPPTIAEVRGGWSDPVDHMAKAAREHIDAQEERRKHAVPPPQEVRDQIAAIRRSMDAKQSGS